MILSTARFAPHGFAVFSWRSAPTIVEPALTCPASLLSLRKAEEGASLRGHSIAPGSCHMFRSEEIIMSDTGAQIIYTSYNQLPRFLCPTLKSLQCQHDPLTLYICTYYLSRMGHQHASLSTTCTSKGGDLFPAESPEPTKSVDCQWLPHT